MVSLEVKGTTPMSRTGILTDRSGFTLIELLVVVVLLSLVTLISFPLLADRGDGAERLKMRRLAGTVKQLYNEATLTRDRFLVTFDIDQNTVETFRLRTGGEQVDKEAFGSSLDLAPLRVREISVDGRGRVRSGKISFQVYPLGWMDATEIVFERQDGNSIQLAFSPLTGTTTIDENVSRF